MKQPRFLRTGEFILSFHRGAFMNDPLNTRDAAGENPLSAEGASGKHARSFYIAGLGASAGGLEALTSFFDAMPVDSGVAFVVVQLSRRILKARWPSC